MLFSFPFIIFLSNCAARAALRHLRALSWIQPSPELANGRKSKQAEVEFLSQSYCDPTHALPESYCVPTRLLLQSCFQKPAENKPKTAI